MSAKAVEKAKQVTASLHWSVLASLGDFHRNFALNGSLAPAKRASRIKLGSGCGFASLARSNKLAIGGWNKGTNDTPAMRLRVVS